MTESKDSHSSSEAESLFPDVQVDTEPVISPPAGSPSPDPAGRVRIELVPEVDQKLRRIADAIGLIPQEVLGHLTKFLSRCIWNGAISTQLETGAYIHAARTQRKRGRTMVLRHIPVGAVDKRRLEGWMEEAGRSLSPLIARRIIHLDDRLSAGRLEEASPENPLDAYQLLIEILHEHVDAFAENGACEEVTKENR